MGKVDKENAVGCWLNWGILQRGSRLHTGPGKIRLEAERKNSIINQILSPN